ncbi:hypothetical protein HPB52_021861 [Rhipicephalus sanguineus]|uniref:Tick transposon n=1 Tax=Rhipicephalus sanguineus TaxID=34632 RepID=A0A9D4PGK0_RHISA|nr:hypothetical protein HPB52_021861 [Rhipicephalus sanguineus]
MASAALSPPPPFLAAPGTPAIPWTRWIRLFENFLLASGAADLPAPRRRALLLHCLGPEGQRIFDALPPTPTAPQLPTTEPLAAAATSTGEVKDRGAPSKQEAAATIPKFQVGKYVRVKKPVPGPKGTPTFGPPLKILKRIGRWSFCLEDGRTWNASQLTAVPKEALPHHALIWNDKGHSHDTTDSLL